MRLKSHVRFLGGLGLATVPGYPTQAVDVQGYGKEKMNRKKIAGWITT